MSLFNLTSLRGRATTSRRRTRTFRPSLNPGMDALEERTVLSAAAVGAAVTQSPLTITGINVTGLSSVVNNTLTATFNLTGQILGQNFTLHNLQLPVTLTGVTAGTPTATGAAVPILHLSLQIPDLNVLGLHVRLDNCNNGPVTVDITAQPGGGLLGDLLSGLAGGAGGLGSINLSTLTNFIDPATGVNGLTEILNGILGGLATTGTTGGAAGTGDTIPSGDTELVDLHVDGIHLNLLGLHVDTSAICLNVYADPNGGLLGNLLSSLDNLLNNHGNNNHAQQVLVRNILRTISNLGL